MISNDIPESEESARPTRALAWRLRQSHISFGRLPIMMGIVNVTPDSFSDGGTFFEPSPAVDHALQLIAQGAEIVDVGGESTRPYSAPVDAAEEIRRVVPVIEAICRQTTTPVSIDTSKAAVAREAIQAGAQIINDVTGLEGDRDMIHVALDSRAGICAMHMQGTPQTMQDDPQYADVVLEIYGYLRQRLEALEAVGIDRDRICLDPGIGFGKTHEHNLTLLSNCDRFHSLGRPLLLGPSRKGFIAKVIGDKSASRDAGTVGVALSLALQGVQILRVHDVASVRQALLLFDATGGMDDFAW